MKKSYLTAATLAAAGVGAVGVSAGTTKGLLGSDTLFDLTAAVITSCLGSGHAFDYSGTASGSGQNAMRDGLQQVAPMSRFLNNGACSGVPPTPDSGTDVRSPASQAEALVIALDSVTIAAWNRTGASDAAAGRGFDGGGDASVACNGVTNADCHTLDPATDYAQGAAFSRSIALADGSAYTFSGWRDVLRVLFAGFDHDNVGTGAANWAARDCNSLARRAIANNYGNFFENDCVAPTGSNATGAGADSVGGHCAMIRHVFRLDDYSGATETVVSLLGLPGIVLPSSIAGTGASPFCNAVRPAFVFPAPQPPCLQGSDFTWVPTHCRSQGMAPVAGAVGPCASPSAVTAFNCHNPADDDVPGRGPSFDREKTVYRAPMQDNDPIRRSCALNEQVCDHSKSLGLVLSLGGTFWRADPPLTNADRYPLARRDAWAAVPPPEVFDAITQRKALPVSGLLCPNGDISTAGCLFPAAGSPASPQVLANVPDSPISTISQTPVPAIAPVPPGLAEGRQYNAHLLHSNGTYFIAQIIPSAGSLNGVQLQGVYYRIHSTKSLNPNGRVCTLPDMTDQIGCLVEASPCSIGYAGRNAASSNINPNTDAIKINTQSPELLCITGSDPSGGSPVVPPFRYPLARKLYLSSTVGFPSVVGEELQFAGCETDLAQTIPGLSPTPAGVMTTSDAGVAAHGFINIPAFVNGGQPYCEDFNEDMLCDAGAGNVNACAAPHPNFTAFPTVNTTCGNGIREAFEDCDCGTPSTATTDPNCTTDAGRLFNGGSFCSTLCRFVN